MIRQCSRCKDFKFWFRFYRRYCDRTSLCKDCGRQLMIEILKPFVLEADR